jgi:ribonucleotide monophosphatase NagD (HAD superfamily)
MVQTPEYLTIPSVGKPSEVLLDNLLEKYSLEETRTLMCGDRLDTDIEFGNGRIDTLLVLTGIATKPQLQEKLPSIEPKNHPTYVAECVRAAVNGELLLLADVDVQG